METEDTINFGAEVFEYEIHGDSKYCESHIFYIRVWIGQHLFTITRSYAAFCMFHIQLKRKYPRTKLPQFPLSAISQFTKSTYQDEDGAITESTLDFKKKVTTFHKVDQMEVIAQKKLPLTQYLEALFIIPEVSMSENLVWMLDEESTDGTPVNLATITSEIDILLQHETGTSKTVSRKYEVEINVNPGTVVAWMFFTRNYDIGFSMTLNGQDVVPFQRYTSQKEIVKGSLAFKGSGSLNMIWDNSYSMMRSKTLVYIVRIFSNREYEAAKEQAAEAANVKQRCIAQRQLLRRALQEQSRQTKNMVSKGNGGVKNLLEEELTTPIVETITDNVTNMDINNNIFEKLRRYEEENRSLQAQLSASEQALVEERNASGHSSDRIDELEAQRESLESEMQDLRNQIDATKKYYDEEVQRYTEEAEGLRSTLNDSQSRVEKLTATNQSLVEETKRLELVIEDLKNNLSSVNSKKNDEDSPTHVTAKSEAESNAIEPIALLGDADRHGEELAKVEQQINKLKSERKQLKTFAIQQKMEIEQLKQKSDSIEKENGDLRQVIEQFKKHVQNMDKENKKLARLSFGSAAPIPKEPEPLPDFSRPNRSASVNSNAPISTTNSSTGSPRSPWSSTSTKSQNDIATNLFLDPLSAFASKETTSNKSLPVGAFPVVQATTVPEETSNEIYDDPLRMFAFSKPAPPPQPLSTDVPVDTNSNSNNNTISPQQKIVISIDELNSALIDSTVSSVHEPQAAVAATKDKPDFVERSLLSTSMSTSYLFGFSMYSKEPALQLDEDSSPSNKSP